MDTVLSRIPRVFNANVLVGFDTSDDAGVYKLSPECALVQTLDFFTPIVDDPWTYGAIAAANSLSDVYAMGGRPITAMSILAWPQKDDIDDLAEILRGGAEKMMEAGCPIVGGHSINDEEIKFGFSVTGTVHPDRIWANSGAREGDVLILTKRIGTGVIATALKKGIAKDEHVAASIQSMLTLNKIDDSWPVHGCTDITGFGLLGHAREMARASGVTIEMDSDAVPLLDGAMEYSAAKAHAAGLANNREFVSCAVEFGRELNPALEALLYDPQTSGGLLLSVPPGTAIPGHVIGRVVAHGEHSIYVA